jgi:N-glycosylase/DNA lyase
LSVSKDVFRKIFGAKAGWAHSVLFAAELPEFRKALPADMQAEMKQFTEANKKLKKDQKDSTNLTKKKSKKEAEGKKKEQLAEDSS